MGLFLKAAHNPREAHIQKKRGGGGEVVPLHYQFIIDSGLLQHGSVVGIFAHVFELYFAACDKILEFVGIVGKDIK